MRPYAESLSKYFVRTSEFCFLYVCSKCAVKGLGGKFVHLGDFVKAVWILHVSGHQSDLLRSVLGPLSASL